MREKANPRFKLFRNVHLVVEKMAVIGQPKLQIHSLSGNVKWFNGITMATVVITECFRTLNISKNLPLTYEMLTTACLKCLMNRWLTLTNRNSACVNSSSSWSVKNTDFRL